MKNSKIILKSIISVFLFSSISFAAGLESSTGVTSNSGALIDSGSTPGTIKETRPADGAITAPPTTATNRMSDKMQPAGVTKKTSRARAKQVCAAGDSRCQQESNPPK